MYSSPVVIALVVIGVIAVVALAVKVLPSKAQKNDQWEGFRRKIEKERQEALLAEEQIKQESERLSPEEKAALESARAELIARERAESEARREEARIKSQDAKDFAAYGPINPVMVCPHCQTKGFIRTKRIEKKGGVSGTKAAGAVLTGGLSVVVTGLSSVDTLTQSHCDHCSNTWVF